MALTDVFHISEIKAESERLATENSRLNDEVRQLRLLLEEIGGNDALRAKQIAAEYDAKCQAFAREAERLQTQCVELESQVEQRRRDLIVVDDAILLETFAFYVPKFQFANSAEYKERLDAVRDKQKVLIRSGNAVSSREGWSVNGDAAEGKRMVADVKKLLLRSFNNECDYCVDNVKFSNVEAFQNRIEKSYEALHKLGRVFSAEVSEPYKRLKISELHLAHEYQCKKQDEKEALRKAREEMREQQKLEQEIKRAREKIDKERKQFANAIRQLEAKLVAADSEVFRAEIQKQLEKLRSDVAALEAAEKEIDYREKNAKAGYVYVISNIGAFGEHVFKIGMTRRLEPEDRVDELGDAAVPFDFDIHAMVFSEDAPALEAKLHSHFETARVNRLNRRKEFYRADIRDIEHVIRENYNKVFDLIADAPAEQFRQGLKLAEGQKAA